MNTATITTEQTIKALQAMSELAAFNACYRVMPRREWTETIDDLLRGSLNRAAGYAAQMLGHRHATIVAVDEACEEMLDASHTYEGPEIFNREEGSGAAYDALIRAASALQAALEPFLPR
jgi:hypothetical protein